MIPATVEVIIICIVSFVPTITELLNDRRGDDNKVQDIVVLTIISLALSMALNFLISGTVVSWAIVKYMVFMWGIHFVFFDYAVVYLLRKNGIIRASAKVFRYTGKSTKWWDQLQARVKWWIRIIFRLAVFAVIVWWVFF